MPALARLTGIGKRFGTVAACRDVSLEVAPGEVHALLGENGAGKTTLMNILYGLVHPDEGTIEFAGEVIAPRTPADSIAVGIGMVHQHPRVVGPLTVAENLFLGGVGDSTPEGARAAVAEVTRTIPLDIDFGARVASLPMSQRQRLEIVRCLARGVRLLVLDEPTAVLTPDEVEQMFGEVEKLCAAGHSVIFITHKLSEVTRIAHRTTVLRAGSVVGTYDVGSVSSAELARAMVGTTSLEGDGLRPAQPGEVKLELDLCTVADASSRRASLDACSVQVRAGEIVGVAGVEGNGQRPLAEVLFGLREPSGGAVRFQGQPLPPVGEWSQLGVPIGRIPEDRGHHGLVLDAPLWENLLLGPRAPRFGRFMRRRQVLDWARRTLEEFDVRPADPLALARNLSGGNQQKVVIARELAGQPEAIIAVNPTRGLDVRAQAEVRERLLAAREQGAAVLLISTDLDEIFATADSIAVLYEGRLAGPFPRAEIDRDRVGMMMGGIDGEPAAA